MQWGLGVGVGGTEISGNLPYLVANTYGLNFIKIGGTGKFRLSGTILLTKKKKKKKICTYWSHFKLPRAVAAILGIARPL